MKQKTIKKAVKVINRSIKFYQRKLTYQLELRAEAEFDNGNLENASFGDYESNIEKYEIILADLATIKRAIKNDKISLEIFGTAESRGDIYRETSTVLRKAGFDYDGDGFGRIDLKPIEEFEEELEEWFEGTPESWSVFDEEVLMGMQLNGLMMQFEN